MVIQRHNEDKINPSLKKQPFEFLDWIICIILFLLVFIVYLLHLAPSIFIGDSAEAVYASYFLGIPHPPGFPVYTWIGHLFTYIPIGDVAYRVNLMSAFFGALVIPIIYLIIQSFPPKSKKGFVNYASKTAAIIGALSLAFSLFYWAEAVIAEVYTLNTFFIALMILFALIWADIRDNRLLYLISILFALSLGISAANILLIPPFLVFLFIIDRKTLLNKKTLSIAVALFICVGVLQFLYLYMRAWQHPIYTYTDIQNIDSFFYFITAGEYSGLLFSYPLAKGINNYFTFFLDNVSLIGILMGIIGIFLSIKRDKLRSLFLASLLVINTLFFITYYSFDVYDKLIPSFMIFSIFIGLGVWGLLDLVKFSSSKKITSKTQKRQYYSNLLIIGLILITGVYIPVNSYISHSKDADRSGYIPFPYFLYQVLHDTPPNSSIIDIWQPNTQLKYFQLVYNINPGVEIVFADFDDWPNNIEKRINTKEVFLLRRDERLFNLYKEVPVLIMPGVGTLYKVYPGNPSFSVSAPQVQHPIHELLGGGNLELLGYNLKQSEEKDNFSLTLYWRMKENISDNYVTMLALVDQQGNAVLTDIHFPIYDIFPTSQWRENEVLTETYNIYYPPTIVPGNYKLVMTGTWKNTTLTTDEIFLGNIEVGKEGLKAPYIHLDRSSRV
jgi:hypothetical protein